MTRLPPMPADAVRLRLPSRREAASEAIGRIMRELDEAGFDKAGSFAVRLALEEAVSNALKHGNRGDESRDLFIEYRVSSENVEIAVEDSGEGFDPNAVPDPTLEENLENPSGRGLMLMCAYMTEVIYNDVGNRVYLRYDRTTG